MLWLWLLLTDWKGRLDSEQRITVPRNQNHLIGLVLHYNINSNVSINTLLMEKGLAVAASDCWSASRKIQLSVQ